MSEARKEWTPDGRIPVPRAKLGPDEVLEALKEAAGDAWLEGRTAEWREGDAPAFRQVWVRVKPEGLRPAVKRLIGIHYPHFVVTAAEDRGETVDLPYLFRIYHGERHAEILVVVTVVLTKPDLKVETITDLVPAALISEREKQEMMGVEVAGIPDGRRMFLPDDFPEGVYPWRKDETGIPAGMIRELWKWGGEAAEAAAAAETKAAEEKPAAVAEGKGPEVPEVPEKPAEAAAEGTAEA